jgi:hypothetical protein
MAGPLGAERRQSGQKAVSQLTQTSRQTGQKGVSKQDLTDVESAVQSFKATALDFSVRYINDEAVRKEYLKTIEDYSKEVIHSVESGKLTPKQGAEFANSKRNEIMEWSRGKSSDIGRARAIKLKPSGLTLEEAQNKYAQKMFSKDFKDLERTGDRNQVYKKVIEGAGRDSHRETIRAQRLGVLGKSLTVLTVSISVYNIAVAEDKLKAAGREGAIMGGSLLGSAVGGAGAAWLFGAAAGGPITLGAFAFGMLFAIGAEWAYDTATED